MGRSIGCCPAIHLAAHRPVRDTVLISPFLSVKELIKEKYGGLLGSLGSILVQDGYDNEEGLRKIKNGGVLVIHGKKDEMISYKQAVKIYGRMF